MSGSMRLWRVACSRCRWFRWGLLRPRRRHLEPRFPRSRHLLRLRELRVFRLPRRAVHPWAFFSKRLAQQQQNPSAGGIPEKAPHGWNPSDWKTIRDHCLQLSAEVVARQHMTPDQLKSVQPFSMRELSDMDACQHMVEPPPAPAAPRTQRDILNSGGS
jgi:hypothetical protein